MVVHSGVDGVAVVGVVLVQDTVEIGVKFEAGHGGAGNADDGEVVGE